MNPLRCFVVAGLVGGCGAAAHSTEHPSEADGAPVAEAATPVAETAGAVHGATPPIEPVAAPPARTNNGSCSADADCGSFKCSRWLWLCYDEATGYVWDAQQNGGLGGWSQPPRYFDKDGDGIRDDDCGQGHVFWPKVDRCYDPLSGYKIGRAHV